MHKQVKVISFDSIQGKLPRLPFVNILGSLDGKVETLSRLPQFMIELGNIKTAERAVALVRFEKNTLREGNYEPGTAMGMVAKWIKSMVAEFNATQDEDHQYALAHQGFNAGYMPPPARYPMSMEMQSPMAPRPMGWPDARFGAAGGFRSAGYRAGYGPDMEFRAIPDQTEQTLYGLSQQIMQLLGDPYPGDPSKQSISMFMNNDKDGKLILGGSGGLGYLVNFELSEITDREVHERTVEAYQTNDSPHSFQAYMATFDHLGREYTVNITHPVLGRRLPDFVTDDALQGAFNQLWCDYWVKLTGSDVRGPKSLRFIPNSIQK